ncbi:MAG: iron-containing alcohol dehydrogenase [Bacilli bacterium]|nr:iron-containing alcohol dehydrogenase [Bacilli bacterium]
MRDFVYENPTKIYFGKNCLDSLGKELKRFGKKVLLVYGGGSIKRNGLYDKVVSIIDKEGLSLFELNGVEPNPRHTTANKGAAICKKEHINVILAVGGGSTIDCSKGIAAAALTKDGDVWPLVSNHIWVTEALPVVSILTNAATGSEMNEWAVISNMNTNEKMGLGGSALFPKVSFENPEYSFSLPSYQTACGAVDIFNHVLDDYYFAGKATFDLSLELQEAIMRNVVKWAPIALKDPSNYEARANLMWSSSIALNNFADAGSCHIGICHVMEHELSAYYDITHGHGLAILMPRWVKYILDENTAPAIKRLGVKVFDIDDSLSPMEGAKETIKALEDFCFIKMGLSSHLKELGIGEEHFLDMAKHAYNGHDIGLLKPLNEHDMIEIYKMCL